MKQKTLKLLGSIVQSQGQTSCPTTSFKKLEKKVEQNKDKDLANQDLNQNIDNLEIFLQEIQDEQRMQKIKDKYNNKPADLDKMLENISEISEAQEQGNDENERLNGSNNNKKHQQFPQQQQQLPVQQQQQTQQQHFQPQMNSDFQIDLRRYSTGRDTSQQSQMIQQQQAKPRRASSSKRIQSSDVIQMNNGSVHNKMQQKPCIVQPQSQQQQQQQQPLSQQQSLQNANYSNSQQLINSCYSSTPQQQQPNQLTLNVQFNNFQQIPQQMQSGQSLKSPTSFSSSIGGPLSLNSPQSLTSQQQLSQIFQQISPKIRSQKLHKTSMAASATNLKQFFSNQLQEPHIKNCNAQPVSFLVRSPKIKSPSLDFMMNNVNLQSSSPQFSSNFRQSRFKNTFSNDASKINISNNTTATLNVINSCNCSKVEQQQQQQQQISVCNNSIIKQVDYSKKMQQRQAIGPSPPPMMLNNCDSSHFIRKNVVMDVRKDGKTVLVRSKSRKKMDVSPNQDN